MLSGLQLRNFALADRVDLDLAAGFTVITGETGAGKSVLIQALAFALGLPGDLEMIGPAADTAEVEAIFDLADSTALDDVAQVLEAADLPFDGELIIRRTVSRPRNGSQRLGGRLRVNDRVATVAVLRDLAPLLADIHGQREQLSLLRPQEQLELLDRYAGSEAEREAVADTARRLRQLDRRLRDRDTDQRTRARRIALLRHEAAEIHAAGLQAGEEGILQAQHKRLVHAQILAADAALALEALEEDTLGSALSAARRIAEIDDSAEPIAASLEAAVEQAAEAVRALRGYADGVELDPAVLAETEARLALLGDLKRRWGDTVEEVIAYGERAAAEADQLEQEALDGDTLAAQADRLADQLAAAASPLSRQRQAAADRLAAAVAAECAALRLPAARILFQFNPILPSSGERSLEVDGELRGFDLNGIDQVELRVAFNPDAPPRPLQRVASGGETARLTLAIKATLGERDAVPLMVFDEVDVGLGGRSGGMIGERLARLGEHCQVLCITHLPQVAACAREHVTVSKSAADGQTKVAVRMLTEPERLTELAEMLGGNSEANRASARDLLPPSQPAASPAASSAAAS